MATGELKRGTGIEVCSIAELERDGYKVVSVEGQTILVLLEQGKPGFPRYA